LRRRTDPKTRTHTLCEPARSKCTWTFDKSHFVQEFTGKMPQTSWIPRPRPALCASPRNRNTFWDVIFTEKILVPRRRPTHCASLRKIKMHFTRAILSGNLQEKCRSPRLRPTPCASLPSRNALGHFTIAILRENLQEKCRGQGRYPHFVHAVRSICTWTFHKSCFMQQFQGTMPGPRWSTLIKHRPLLLPEPLSVDTVWGKYPGRSGVHSRNRKWATRV